MAEINANLLTMVEETVTSGGVRFSSTLDGGIRVVGTATQTGEFWFSSTIGGANKNPIKVDNGTYTLSAEGLTGSLRLITSGGGGNGFVYTELYSTSAPKVSVVSNGSKPFNYFLLRVNAGEVLDTTVYAKLEEGDTATPWQPYANDTSGGGAVMSDDIITLGYNGRGGRILMTNHLAAHLGETCTLSFWTRIDSDEPISKGALVYPYQSNGIEIAKFPGKIDGSNDLYVTLTEEWQFVEYTGTICQMQDIAGRTAGEMFIWSNANNGGPNIQLAGIMLTLAGGGCFDE